MTSERPTGSTGFTLLEVMAAVLVLGLLYTVLAGSAMHGLRSEGTDRRRADAEMIADRELSGLEIQLAGGVPLEDGRVEREQQPFKVSSEVEPFDAFHSLPAPLPAEIARSIDPSAPSLLHDERGTSRVRRVTVVVAWQEAGQPNQVERTTFAFDTSVLEQLFPSTGANAARSGIDRDFEEMQKSAPPELKPFMPTAPPRRGRSR